MIQAFTHSNTGILKLKEDTLTSFVLAQMLFLEDRLIWRIFKDACFGNNLPDYVGHIEFFDFWPHWDSKEKESKKNYVEPDMFIRFEKLDVIIEAKRYDVKQQNVGQWKNEFIAYHNEYSDEDRKVIMFAIGGIHQSKTETISVNIKQANDEEKTFHLKVFKFKWQNILNEFIKIKNKLEISEEILGNMPALIRTISSIVKAFEMHGYFTGKWLEELPKYKILQHNSIENWEVKKWKLKKHFLGKKMNSLSNNYSINSIIKNWKPYE